MFSGVKIVPIIDQSIQIGDYVKVNNQDDDMNGKTGTFVYQTNNIDGEIVFMILLDDKKHYSTYPKFLKIENKKYSEC
jgi:hypothetical protein